MCVCVCVCVYMCVCTCVCARACVSHPGLWEARAFWVGEVLAAFEQRTRGDEGVDGGYIDGFGCMQVSVWACGFGWVASVSGHTTNQLRSALQWSRALALCVRSQYASSAIWTTPTLTHTRTA